ncbi:hypothetical protein TI03_07385, partial [Achromatium sp. WMS1]
MIGKQAITQSTILILLTPCDYATLIEPKIITKSKAIMDTLPVMKSLTMSSREIAELLGKEHFHVLRDIRIMIEQLSAHPNLDWHCKLDTYIDEQG